MNKDVNEHTHGRGGGREREQVLKEIRKKGLGWVDTIERDGEGTIGTETITQLKMGDIS